MSLLSEFLQHRWSHSFKISPTQGIAVALLEMAKQKVESISFTKGWDGYRINFAIMEPDYKDIENIRKHQKCCENCWLFPQQLASFLMFEVSDPKAANLQIFLSLGGGETQTGRCRRDR